MPLNLLRWAGGKGRQLNDLLPLIPRSKIYCEPFGGGASVLLNRERSEIEVYNDLDGALVNLFDVVRGNHFYEFCHRLAYTPYAREVFEKSTKHEDVEDPVERAVQFYVSINQSFSGKRLARPSEWSRARGDNLADRWVERQKYLGDIHDRLSHVQIECRDALDILEEWDTDDTCFYCDPPYVIETRSKSPKLYAIEPGDEYHERLVDVLLRVRGMVVLSGYDHPIYNRLVEEGWWTDLYGAHAVMEITKLGAQKSGRTEMVLRNKVASERAIMTPLPLTGL